MSAQVFLGIKSESGEVERFPRQGCRILCLDTVVPY